MNLRLLLDEHISPFLTSKLAALGIFAQAVPHVGLSGKPDQAVWAFAIDHDMVVVTTNVTDFLELADVELHPGLILLRESGLSRDQQWNRLEPAILFAQSQSDPYFLLNRVLVIEGPGRFHMMVVQDS